MNKLVKPMLMASLLSLGGVSASALGHGQSESGMGSMMDRSTMQQQMKNMHSQMQENQALMDQIMNEKDRAKRQALMREHMQSMHQQMHMISQPGDGAAKAPLEMQERMERMDMRMDMMQMMLEQMMQHQEQLQ